MATQKVKSSNPINNNGGTVINAGNYNSSGPISNDLKPKDLNVAGTYGSQIVENIASSGDYTYAGGVRKAKRSGTFAYSPEKAGHRNFIIKAVGTSSAGKINGTSSTLLNTLGSEFAGIDRGKANTVGGTFKQGEITWTFPIVPGSGRVPGRVRGSGVGEYYNYGSTTDSDVAASDKAVNGTKAVPGSITYRTGAPKPVTTNLKARDSAEA